CPSRGRVYQHPPPQLDHAAIAIDESNPPTTVTLFIRRHLATEQSATLLDVGSQLRQLGGRHSHRSPRRVARADTHYTAARSKLGQCREVACGNRRYPRAGIGDVSSELDRLGIDRT